MKDIVRVPDVLLPKEGVDLKKWAVIACDQFTSQGQYWQQLSDYCGETSALNIIFPEYYLDKGDMQERIRSINDHMTEYLTKVVKKNKLKPAATVDEIIQFFIVNYHGIQSGYVLTECFKAEHIEGKYKIDDMYRNLATSVVLMMGGKAIK